MAGEDSRSETVTGSDVKHASDSSRAMKVILSISVVAVLLVIGSVATSRGWFRKDAEAPVAARPAEKQGNPNTPAAEGAELLTVVRPPSKTRLSIELPATAPEAEFDVAFKPYGVAPDGRLVLKVVSIEVREGGEQAEELARRLDKANLVAGAAEGVNIRAIRGGQHSGIIRTVAGSRGRSFSLVRLTDD